MKLINLTPHDINLQTPSGEIQTIPKSGNVARVKTLPREAEDTGLPVPTYPPTRFGEIDGLPPQEQGVVFIVSSLILSLLDREDCVAPATGPNDGAIRNERGHIMAVTRLVRAK